MQLKDQQHRRKGQRVKTGKRAGVNVEKIRGSRSRRGRKAKEQGMEQVEWAWQLLHLLACMGSMWQSSSRHSRPSSSSRGSIASHNWQSQSQSHFTLFTNHSFACGRLTQIVAILPTLLMRVLFCCCLLLWLLLLLLLLMKA